MEKAGFVDIVESQEVWPIGTWPKDKKLKEIGRWGRAGSEDSVLPFAIHMLTKQGWKVDDVKKLCDAVVESYKKQKYFFEAWFVYGRKPEKKKSEC